MAMRVVVSCRSRFRAAPCVVFVCLGALPGPAFAQAPAPPPEREGSIEFAFVGTSGNSSTQTIGLGAEYIYRPSVWETRFRTTYVRNESENELKAQAFLLAFRATRPVRPRVSGFGQYGYQRDRFAGILHRNSLEGGLAYQMVDQAPHQLTLDAGLGYANEQRLLGSDLSAATLGAGGVYALRLSETSELSEDAHFVFSLSEGGDWRLANVVALTAQITTLFSLKLSNTIRYVNLPVADFQHTDTVTAIALVAEF
jgi:putative salt-induced outer membrane protein